MATALIYCAHGNKRFAEIALRHGYLYGAQLPNTVYFAPTFTDQNWRKPDRTRYMEQVAKYRPAWATVLDWERQEQLPEVLDWAEEAAALVSEAVIIIPKVVGGIKRLPRCIGGKQVRLGYSAATTFAGTPVFLDEFKGYPIHCLGGSVARQMEVARVVEVVSADGNYIQNLARRNCQFYSPGFRARSRGWPTLRESGLHIEWDAPYVAFELTCIGVPMAWQGCAGAQILEAQYSWLKEMSIEPESKALALF